MADRYVQLPNGSYLQWPEGVSAAEFKAKAQKVMGSQKASETPLPAGVKQTGFNSAGQRMIGTEDVPEPSYWDALTDPVGSGGRQQGLVSGALQVGGQAIKTMAQPFLHPIDTAVGVANTAGSVAKDALRTGDLPGAIGKGVLGPMVQSYARDKAKGGNALAIENLTGNLLGTLESGRIGGEFARDAGEESVAGAKGIRDWWRPRSSPEIVPTLEQNSRALTNAINPNPAEANSFIENIQQRMPEITDYAKRTKNPLKTRLEFAKAAEGAGREARSWYRNNLLDPVANEEVSVGPNYRGKSRGEAGQRATLGAIDKRLGEINEELSPTYRQRNAGMVGSKLATEAELNAEAAGLRSILNRELAKSSGLSEAEVSAVRQTGGQLRHISDATNETVTQRGLSAERAKEGSLPTTRHGVIDKALKGAAGGQDAIQDRAFQRALADFNEQRPSTFQQIADKFAKSERPVRTGAARNPRPQPAGPSEPPSAHTISQTEQEEFVRKLNEKLAGRKAAIAARAQQKIEAAAAEEARKAANLATAGKRLGSPTGPTEPPSAGMISEAEQQAVLDRLKKKLASRKLTTQRQKDLERFNSQF